MCCEACRDFLEQYLRAIHAYCEASQSLASTPEGAFTDRWHRTETARRNADRCRNDFLAHQHSHEPRIPEAMLDPVGAHMSEDFILGDQGQPGG